jgi:hypothetical protein
MHSVPYCKYVFAYTVYVYTFAPCGSVTYSCHPGSRPGTVNLFILNYGSGSLLFYQILEGFQREVIYIYLFPSVEVLLEEDPNEF